MSIAIGGFVKDDQGKDDLDKDKKDKQDKATFSNPTTSSPIALSADNTLLWVVNPTDNSVSTFWTESKHLLTTIRVGKEPQSVALDPSNRFAYVANTASNDVSVIRIHNPNPDHFKATLINSFSPEPSRGTWSYRLMVGGSSSPTVVRRLLRQKNPN
jgi:6-phosphogluconolactonase (cycloisomerase 2 family)